MRPKTSIAGLMALVSVAALGSAIAAFASQLRADAVVVLTAGVLTIASLGVLMGRRGLRAFCLGFMIAGWAYFAAAFGSPQVRLSLPTTRPLVHLYESLIGSPTTLKPDEFVPWLLHFHDYLRVAHAITALAIAIAGGLLAASITAMVRRRNGPAA